MKPPYETFQSRNISKHDQTGTHLPSIFSRKAWIGWSNRAKPVLTFGNLRKQNFLLAGVCNGHGCVSSNKRTALGLRVGLDYRLWNCTG